MTWNKKNQQIEMLAGLRQSTVRVAQHILPRTNKFKPTKLMVDLKVINQKIAKHRGRPYDPKTMKEAIAQLDEKTFGWFKILKSYSWHLHEVMVYPVEMVLQNLSENRDLTPSPNRGKPMYDDEHKGRLIKQQQQDISNIDRLFLNLSMKFTYDALVDIYRKADKKVSEVKKAVKLMLFRHSTQTEQIKNPCGWVRRCLQFGWQDNYDPYYQVKLPVFSNTTDLDSFVDRGCPSPEPGVRQT